MIISKDTVFSLFDEKTFGAVKQTSSYVSWVPQWVKNTRLGLAMKAALEVFMKPDLMHHLKYRGASVNFLLEVVRSKDSFDVSTYFPDDEEAVMQSFCNIILCHIGHLPSERFSEEDKKKVDALGKRISRKRRVFFQGKKYYIHPNSYTDVLYYEFGLPNLPARYRDYVRQKIVLDIGAYVGDSAITFLQLEPTKIVAYEPVPSLYDALLQTIQKNKLEHIIEPICKALGATHGVLKMSERDGASLISEHGDIEVEASTIDRERSGMETPIGLIKMDIEDFEPYALRGAEETIQKDCPILLISIYHSYNSFCNIPKYLKELVPDYTFRFLDLKPFSAADKYLLGLPPENKLSLSV